MVRKNNPTSKRASEAIEAELTRKHPHAVAAITRRGRVIYANAAFASMVDLQPRKVAGTAAGELLSPSIVEALIKETSQEWRDRQGRLYALSPFKVRGSIGIAAHPVGPSTESGVWKALALLDDLIARFPAADFAPGVQAVRSALLPAEEGVSQTAVKAEELVARLLKQRAARVGELGLVVTPPQGSARVPEDAAAEIVGAVLDQCMSELRVRPLPRALRIALATERDGSVTLKLTHNGVQQSHRRLAAEAARWGVRFTPASSGPGLGVTYALTFASVE